MKGKDFNTFVTYEDERSIAQKARYINEHNLAGAMIWDITGDCLESRSRPGEIEKTPLADALLAALCQQEQAPFASVEISQEYPGPLPAREPRVSRNAFAPRIVHKAPLSKKEQRKLKKQQKKLGKLGRRAVYHDAGQ